MAVVLAVPIAAEAGPPPGGPGGKVAAAGEGAGVDEAAGVGEVGQAGEMGELAGMTPPQWQAAFYRGLWLEALDLEGERSGLDAETRALLREVVEYLADRTAGLDWPNYEFPSSIEDREAKLKVLRGMERGDPLVACIERGAMQYLGNLKLKRLGDQRLDRVAERYGPLVAATLDHALATVAISTNGLGAERWVLIKGRVATRLLEAMRGEEWDAAYDRPVVRIVQRRLDNLPIEVQERVG